MYGTPRRPFCYTTNIYGTMLPLRYCWFFLLFCANVIPYRRVAVASAGNNNAKELTLVDFTTLQTLHGWVEISDVIRNIGKSKAVLALQKTYRFQRAVLFTMLNPQPDGAGFAGYRLKTEFNLTAYHSLQLLCRGQGDYYGYKAVLRHNREPFPLYEHMFQAPQRKFKKVTLPFSHFEPYYRGRKQANSSTVNTAHITSLEIHVYGGVYLPVKQSGTASLEIDWIKAV